MPKKVTFTAYGKQLRRYTILSPELTMQILHLLCPSVNNVTIEVVSPERFSSTLDYCKDRYDRIRVIAPSKRQRAYKKRQQSEFWKREDAFIEDDLINYLKHADDNVFNEFKPLLMREMSYG